MTEIEQAIKAEMRKALAQLGAKSELLARIDAANSLDAATRYRVTQRLGADRYLLAAIGSFRDTLDDETVLQDLRDWNAAPWETPPFHLRR